MKKSALVIVKPTYCMSGFFQHMHMENSSLAYAYPVTTNGRLVA